MFEIDKAFTQFATAMSWAIYGFSIGNVPSLCVRQILSLNVNQHKHISLKITAQGCNCVCVRISFPVFPYYSNASPLSSWPLNPQHANSQQKIWFLHNTAVVQFHIHNTIHPKIISKLRIQLAPDMIVHSWTQPLVMQKFVNPDHKDILCCL